MFHPNRKFQAGLNHAEARRKREKNNHSSRQKKRESKLQNKRKKIVRDNNTSNSPGLSMSIHGVYNSNTFNIHKSIVAIRELLCSDDPTPTIKEIIDNGILSRIVNLLQNNNYNIVYESVWCIINIVGEDVGEYTASVIEAGALNPLINLLKIPNYPMQEVVVTALGNIAMTSRDLKNSILKRNTLEILIKMVAKPFNNGAYYEYKYDTDLCDTPKGQYLELINKISSIIRRLSRGTTNDNDNEYTGYKLLIIECIHHIIKIKNKFIFCENNEINKNISWSIHYLIPSHYECPNILINKMNELNVLKYLIFLLKDAKNKFIFRQIVSTITTILSGDNTEKDIYTQMCIKFGLLKAYHMLLNGLINNNDATSLRMLSNICLCIANINLCADIGFLNSVFNENVFPMVCQLLTKQHKVSTKALYAIGNAINTAIENNNSYIIQYLCDENKCNAIKYLCHYNKMQFMNGIWEQKKETTLNISLECIENMLLYDEKNKNKMLLEEYGIDFLEHMETVDEISDEQYERIGNILKTYFVCRIGPDIQENYYKNDNNDINIIDLSFENNIRQM